MIDTTAWHEIGQLQHIADDLAEALRAMIEQYEAANEVLPAYYQALSALDKFDRHKQEAARGWIPTDDPDYSEGDYDHE